MFAKSHPFVLLLLMFGGLSCQSNPVDLPVAKAKAEVAPDGPAGAEIATFGNGCFWCTEAVFLRLKGVQSVKSGYTGGSVKDPTYEQVCDETTGHAEAVRIAFDPAIVSYKDLLAVFFQSHDPTTLNRQGADVGARYRSVVFFHSDAQKQAAEQAKKALDEAKIYPNPIVTEIAPAATFYPAENYHQDYFARNGEKGYCQFVIRPKLEKLQAVFKDKLR